MPFVTIPADTWTSVVTTTQNTALENKSGGNIVFTTESTGGLDGDAGVTLSRNNPVWVGTGLTVSCFSKGVASRVYYCNL